MMKIKLPFILLCFSVSMSFSQITSRVMIQGKISTPIGDDVEGIVIYNRNTDKGTVTNEKGGFKISAGIGDRVEVVAMQYQNFVVLVDKGVLESRRLSIFLNESVNQLDEVIVTPYDLLGNVVVDVKKIGGNTGAIKQVAQETSTRINDADYDFVPDNLTPIENKVFLEDRMINGLNFVNLFKFIYDNKIIIKKKDISTDMDVKIREVYNDDFFKDYLALQIDQISEFIFFAEDNGLDNSYFEEGKELDLLQFLVYQSKLYKEQQ